MEHLTTTLLEGVYFSLAPSVCYLENLKEVLEVL